jgi:hypothetical protein
LVITSCQWWCNQKIHFLCHPLLETNQHTK